MSAIIFDKRWTFYIVWLLLLLLQAYNTELIADEAYYWMYSRRLAWGYFDHPPMIALLIRLGTTLLPGEIGVRLLPVLLSVGTAATLQRLIRPSRPVLFFSVYAAVALLHFMGFMALPDAPLLFFTALFLLLYKKWIDRPVLRDSLLLGVLVAAMCLSKYHGVIIMMLVILSQLRLLRSPHFWLMIVVAALVSMPHLIWLVQHDFPSIRYHLIDRNVTDWHIGKTFEYLGTAPFALGPFAGVLFFISVYKSKAKNRFEKTLQYLFWGGYIFFFIMSFRDGVEAHWILFTVLPGLYFGYKFLEEKKSWSHRWLSWSIASLVLILVVRILILKSLPYDFSTALAPVLGDFHRSEMMAQISERVGGRDVVFINSYQDASLYNFYGETEGITIRTQRKRANQYTLWNDVAKFRGRDVMSLPNYPGYTFDSLTTMGKLIYVYHTPSFRAFPDVEVVTEVLEERKDSVIVRVHFEAAPGTQLDVGQDPNFRTQLSAQIYKVNEIAGYHYLHDMTNSDFGDTLLVAVPVPRWSGDYQLYLALESGFLPPMANGPPIDLHVE